MELNFIKNEATRYWECEFEATADFNLHIEGVPEGKVWIYQRTTASGEHAYIKEATPYPSLVDVYDFDFSALIYPKFVKVVCGTEPTYAEVVSNGEITELKYQEKSVELTANGNTEVIPDAGFMGLTKVNVSVNVPQSGGEGGSTFEYLDITNVTGMNGNLKILLFQMAYMGKVPQAVKVNSITMKQGIVPLGSYMYIVGSTLPGSEAFTQVTNAITAISIDFSTTINFEGQVLTIQELFAMYGVQSDIDAIPRITEEEFYNLNA